MDVAYEYAALPEELIPGRGAWHNDYKFFDEARSKAGTSMPVVVGVTARWSELVCAACGIPVRPRIKRYRVRWDAHTRQFTAKEDFDQILHGWSNVWRPILWTVVPSHYAFPICGVCGLWLVRQLFVLSAAFS